MMIKNTMGMIGNEAGGMWKEFVILVSMVKPCWIENVWSWARQSVIIIVQQKTGIMLSKIFAFSTCVTLQSLHGLIGFSDCCCCDVWIIAALSKNLEKIILLQKWGSYLILFVFEFFSRINITQTLQKCHCTHVRF